MTALPKGSLWRGPGQCAPITQAINSCFPAVHVWLEISCHGPGHVHQLRKVSLHAFLICMFSWTSAGMGKQALSEERGHCEAVQSSY